MVLISDYLKGYGFLIGYSSSIAQGMAEEVKMCMTTMLQ